MKKVDILNFNSMASFDEFSDVNVITTFPLPFYNSAVSFSSLNVRRGLESVEVATIDTTSETAVNSADNIGKVAVNQNNQLVFFVAPDKVANACMAKEYIVGFIISYLTGRVVYVTPSNTATYNMIVERGADNAFVSSYKQSALSDLLKLIPGLDNTLNVDMTGGYVYKIFRDMTNCKA